MKKFLLRLFQFFLIPAVFILLMESAIFILKKDILSEKRIENVYKNIGNEYQWIKKINHSKKILLLGSSCVRYGLSCSQLDELSKDSLKFLNCAMDSRDPIETYFLLKQMNLSDVKAVYFGLDPWIYSRRYYRHVNFYLYLDLNFIRSVRYCLSQDKRIFLKRYLGFFMYLFQLNFIDYKTNQEIPSDYGSEKLIGRPGNFNEAIDTWYEIDKYGWSQLQFTYLKEIAILCKERNIEFNSFIPPKRSDFSKIYKTKCKLIHKEYVNNLIDVNFDAPIYGTFDQLDAIRDINLFSDAYHISNYGQMVYSILFHYMILNKKTMFSAEYSWFSKK